MENILEQRDELIKKHAAVPLAIKTDDGFMISTLLIQRPGARRIFVVCHGFKHTKEHMGHLATLFPHDTLIFLDLRGQGESSGDKVSLGLNEHNDILAVIDYVKKSISVEVPVIGIGVSQGGAALLRAAAYGARFDAVISDSAPSDFKYTIACVLQKFNKIPYPLGFAALSLYEWLMHASFTVSDYTNYAHRVKCPVLLMHDVHDHLIDYCHAQKLFQAISSSCKELWTVQNTRHGKISFQIPEEYKQHIESFLSRCLHKP